MVLHLDHGDMHAASFDAAAAAERVRAIRAGRHLSTVRKAMPGSTSAVQASMCEQAVDEQVGAWADRLAGHAAALTSADAAFTAADEHGAAALTGAGLVAVAPLLDMGPLPGGGLLDTSNVTSPSAR